MQLIWQHFLPIPSYITFPGLRSYTPSFGRKIASLHGRFIAKRPIHFGVTMEEDNLALGLHLFGSLSWREVDWWNDASMETVFRYLRGSKDLKLGDLRNMFPTKIWMGPRSFFQSVGPTLIYPFEIPFVCEQHLRVRGQSFNSKATTPKTGFTKASQTNDLSWICCWMVKRDVDTSHSGLKEGLETKRQACSSLLKLHVCNLQNIPETSGKGFWVIPGCNMMQQLVCFDTLHLKMQTVWSSCGFVFATPFE